MDYKEMALWIMTRPEIEECVRDGRVLAASYKTSKILDCDRKLALKAAKKAAGWPVQEMTVVRIKRKRVCGRLV